MASLRISRYQAGFWDELAALGVVGHQAAAWREQVQGLLSADVGRAEPPAGLRARLRPYQQDGFGWLAFLWEHRLGGILADDMGLGKTLQCLALISHARQRQSLGQSPGDPAAGPFLIVAPTSVVGNWAAEAARFAPDLRVVPVSGTVARLGKGLGELAAGADAVVTTYALLRIDFAAYAEVGWSGLLLDDGPSRPRTASRRSTSAPAALGGPGQDRDHRHAAGEQRDGAVVAAVDHGSRSGAFPNPDRFRDYYARPVERQGDRATGWPSSSGPDTGSLVLRRTKDQVAAELARPSRSRSWRWSCTRSTARSTRTRLQRERQKVLGLDRRHGRQAASPIFRSLTLLRQPEPEPRRASSTRLTPAWPRRQDRRPGRPSSRR